MGAVPEIPGPDGTAVEFLAVISALTGEVSAQRGLIEELRDTIRRQEELITELRARLGRNSSNSSKPPSSDGLKPAPKSLRRPSRRKPGGQPGHEGKTVPMADRPDRVVEHRPARCAGCGTGLAGAGTAGVERRQVVDPPEIRPEVVEHRIHAVACPSCGRTTKAQAPEGAARQVQYGPNANALMVYLVAAQHLSIGRCAQAMAEIMGLPVSTATVTAAQTRAADAVAERFTPAVKQLLAGSHTPRADETGFKVGGRTMWAHSASNDEATLIDVHPKRGKQATDDIGVLPAFHGALVHDAWPAYDAYPGVAAHQLCDAHVPRELRAVSDWHHDNNPGAWCWADQCADALRAAINDPEDADRARRLITDALAADTLHNHPPGKLGNKHRALADRPTQRLDDYLRFTTTPGVPPTNNPAEQETRMVKIKMKITGGMRTLKGAREFAAIRSYLATARKHLTTPLTAITSLFTPENTWLPTTP